MLRLKPLFLLSRVLLALSCLGVAFPLVAQTENDQFKRERDLKQYEKYLNLLKTSPLSLITEPSPIEIGGEGESVIVKISLDSPQGNYLDVARSLEKVVADITGYKGNVTIDYEFGIPGKRGSDVNIWYTKSPSTVGVYPLSVKLKVSISGDGLTGSLAELKQSFLREVVEQVEVVRSVTTVDYTKGIWPELRKTKVISVNTGFYTYRGEVQPSGSISFTSPKQTFTDVNGNETSYWGDIQMTLGADGKTIEELSLVHMSEDADKTEQFKSRYIYLGLELSSLTEETDTKATFVSFRIDEKKHNYLWGSGQEAYLRNGEWVWNKLMPIGRSNKNPAAKMWGGPPPTVSFTVAESVQKQKKLAEKQAREIQQTTKAKRKAAAQDGAYYVGTFGKDKDLKGEMKLSIGADKTSVAGKFSGSDTRTNKGVDYKNTVSGEFLGEFDPDTGRLEAQLSSGSMYAFKKVEGKWYPLGSPRGIPKETKVLGRLKAGSFTGHLEFKGKEIFKWTASQAEREGG